jgi:PAS domain S-box-containing protein
MKLERQPSPGKKDLIKVRNHMLMLATAILLILSLAHGVIARIPWAQVAFNLIAGLAITWGLTFLIFNLVFRLAAQVAKRDKQLSRREEELQALQRISQQISATVDLEKILHLILQAAMQLTESDHGYIALTNEDEELELITARGYDVPGHEQILSTEQPIGAHVMHTGEPLNVVDTQAVESPVSVMTETRSMLASPIAYEGSIAGPLVLHKETVRGYEEQDIAFVGSLTRQASIAIGNARQFHDQVRLNERLRRRTEQQQHLFEVSCSLRMDKPLNVILEDIAYAVQDSVGFNIALISVVQGDPPYLQRTAAAGVPLDAMEKLKERPQAIAAVKNMVQERFQLSQSYFIPHQHKAVWESVLDTAILIPKREENQAAWHPEDILFTPLYGSEEELIGVISVDDPQDGKLPTRSRVELLETFAAQAALAIENAQLYGTAQRRVSELDTLNRISQALSSSLELDDLVELVYRHTHPIFDSSRFILSLYDLELEKLEFPYVVDNGSRVSDQDVTAFEQYLISHVLDTRTPLLLSPKQPEQTPEIMEGKFEGSWIVVPLLAATRLIGAIALQTLEQDRAYDSEQLNLMRTMASQAAAALQNATVYDQIRRFNTTLEERVQKRTEELVEANRELALEKERAEALYQITSELSTSLDLDRVLYRALTLLTEATGTELGTVMLFDRQEEELRYRTLVGTERALSDRQREMVIPHDVGLIGWLLEHRETLLSQNISEDERWQAAPQTLLGEVQSLVAAPLLMGDEVLGILMLADERPDLLNQEHIRLVSAAASQVAQAISNAELYNLILEQAQRLGDALQSQQSESSEKDAILDSIADGVLVVDPQDRIILLNRAGEDILDAKAANLIDKPVSLFAAEAQTRDDRAIAGLSLIHRWLSMPWQQLEGSSFEEQFEADGRIINVRMNTVQANGTILGAVAVFRDMTKEVEADRAKSEFISTVSHELRTPMTSIKGYTDLLLMSAVGELNEQQRRFLDTVKTNVDRLADLVADLLDISRIESGRLRLELEELELGKVLTQAASALRGQFAARRILIESEIGDGLKTLGDAERITQVITNILQNACQYTRPGGQVVLSAYREGQEIRIDVADTGIGISEKDQKRLFERFFRADHPVVMETQGTGLGLAIIKSIVEMHNGRVWIESELEEGTTVSFTLPFVRPNDTDQDVETVSAEVSN